MDSLTNSGAIRSPAERWVSRTSPRSVALRRSRRGRLAGNGGGSSIWILFTVCWRAFEPWSPRFRWRGLKRHATPFARRRRGAVHRARRCGNAGILLSKTGAPPPATPASMSRGPSRHRLGELVIDTTPLRASRQFRLLMLGQVLSVVGSNFTAIAVPFQVYVLTGSSLLVGVTGLVEVVPLLAGMLAGGALADAMDRRRLLIGTRLALTVVGVGLALNAGTGRHGLWLGFPLIAANAALTGLGGPARSA